MSSLGRITKATKVEDAEKLLTVPSVLVTENEGLRELAEKVAESPLCKTLAVVDGALKLLGVIPVGLVIDDVFLHVMPEEFLSDVMDFENAVDFARRVAVTKAKDLMQAPVWDKKSDTVEDAFERMHRHQLGGLPIVDDEMRVTGYIDMLELLLVWIRTRGE